MSSSNKIDQLEIEVVTNSEGAIKGLEDLKKSLFSLKNLGEDLSKKMPDISKMASVNTNNGSIKNAKENIQKVSTALGELPTSTNIDITAVGAESTETATGEIAENLVKSTNSADLLEMKLDGVMKKLSEAVDNDASSDTIANLIQQAQRLGIQLDNIGTKPTELAKNLISTTTPAELLQMKLDGVNEKLQEALANPVPNNDVIANLIEKAQKLQGLIDKINAKPIEPASVKSVNALLGTTKSVDVLKMQLDAVKTKLATMMADPNADKGAIANLIKKAKQLEVAIEKAGKKFRIFGNEAHKSTKKAQSGFAQLFKIVVLYGSAFRMWSLFTTGVSEGLQNVAQYNDETAAAMSRLSTMSLYLKNSIGAALYPVIVALTPALQTVTNAIVRLLEAMGQLVSMLSGKTTYLKAKEYLKSYVDTAKGAAAQIKKSFAGMDEITVIGNKDSGSAGGGGGEDYGSMFEEVPIDNPKLQALLPFFQGLGAVFSSCFETLKQLANDYLYPWLVDIGNWCEENPDTLETIGKGLAYVAVGLLAIMAVGGVIKIINSLIEPLKILFGLFSGKGGLAVIGVILAISGIVMFIRNLVDMFKEGINWSNALGVVLGVLAAAAGVFLVAIALGASVATAGIAALVVIALALRAILLAISISLWDEISGFFINLWNTVTSFFVNTWNSIVSFFGGIATWIYDTILQPIIAFFEPFVTAICGFFQAIWSVVSSVFSLIWHYVSTVFTAIYDVVSYIIGTIISIIVGLGQAVWAVISKIYEIVSTIVQMIWAVVSWLFGLLWDFISGIATWVWENALKPIVNFVTDLVIKIVEKMTSIVNTIKTKVVDPIVNFFKGMIDTVVGFFKNIAIKVVDAISGTFRSVLNGVFTIVEKVVNFFIKGINGAIGIINNIPGVEIKKIDLLSIPRFATGGFPEDGLFMANHGELVGKFSNGKTAVANNEQIVEGITGGVYAANQEQNGLLREQNKLLRQLVESRSNGQIDVTTITSAMQRKNRRDGKTIVPVGI